MATRNGGKHTEKDKAELTRQQNKASKKIYNENHNDQTANVGKYGYQWLLQKRDDL
ncbi:MAG: hypothetical protein ACLPN1_15270 [Dissulfurispiraceae bacterium]|jgi:hypothetical protein